MQWRIKGADRSTGRERIIVVKADSSKEAEAASKMANMLVESIEAVAEPIEWLAAAVEHSVPNPPSPQTPVPSPAPTYNGLAIAGTIVRVVGFFYYVAGGIAGVRAALLAGTGDSFGDVRLAIDFSLYALAFVTIGALFHGLGTACVALRDIARNSWAGNSH